MRKLLYLIVIITILTSCSVKEHIVEVPIETIKTEYIHDTRIDSVYVRDSVDRWVKGDTIFLYKERVKYKYLNTTDTVVKVDSIPKVVQVKTVERVEVNHIKWYQNVLMWIGGITSLVSIAFIIFKLRPKWK